MRRTQLTVELSDDILFITRSLPAREGDLIRYIEAQISELLFAGETLDDIVYRFGETGDGILIAIARIATLQKHPLPAGITCYRIPTAVGFWQEIAPKLASAALLFRTHGDRAYLLSVDGSRLHQVHQARNDETGHVTLAAAVEKQRERRAGDTVLYHQEKLPEPIAAAASRAGIASEQKKFAMPHSHDRGFLDQWDFRLDAEVQAQEKGHQKNRVVRSALITAAALAAFWLLLLLGDWGFARLASSALDSWNGMQGPLREVSYCNRQTRQYIGEIMLCRKLSERRTDRATILEKLAEVRPEQVRFTDLRIGTRKRVAGTGGTEEQVVVKGSSSAPAAITAWMERLGEYFSTVNLLSMERKGGAYLFTIECGVTSMPHSNPERSKGAETGGAESSP